MRRLGLAILIVPALLVALLAGRTVTVRGPAIADVAAIETPPLDEDAPRRLAAALTFRTISSDAAPLDREAFLRFHDFLRESYPLVHERLVRTEIAGLSLLYEWPGDDPAAQPVLFLAHQDVVPAVAPGSWTHPPFAGAVADGYVWGRGAMDDKSSLLGWLEAVERLLSEGFRPARTVYLAFGHDEETGGGGARAVAGHLAGRGVRLKMVLDEGGFVGRGLIAGVDAPVALVGIAEKGYLTVRLSVEAEGGHSSRPPRETAIGTLSRAVATLEQNPFPSRLDGAAAQMFDHLLPHLPFAHRLVVANRWLLEPVLLSRLADNPTTATLVRTTIAPTMLRAGEKENVLATQAEAAINLRILPGETVEGTVARLRRVIDDPRVAVRATTAHEPSPVSSTTSASWELIRRTLHEVLGSDVVVAPYLLVAGTDSRHFVPIADDVYRFFAMTVTPDDVARFHGADERISLADYERLVAVYSRLLRNLSGEPH